MNTLTRTVVVFTVVSLVSAVSVLAQGSSSESSREAFAAQRESQIMQAQAAQRQAHALVAAVAAPVAPAAPAPPAAPASAIAVSGPWPPLSGGASSVLVIPSAETKAEDVAAIAEDMNVMSRIFENNLEQARIPTVRGGLFASSRDPWVALLGGGSAIQGMYLQGYGALFLMKVDFPLSAPPQAQEQPKAEQKTDADPVWEQMRREMYEPQEAGRGPSKEPEQKYDPEKLENLKTTLVKALKHAANIRSLASGESVILVVAGSGESGGARVSAIHGGHVAFSQRNQIVVAAKSSDGTDETTTIVKAPSSSQPTYFSPTALVIRAKKSDIDEFAKGSLDADQFRQRAQVFACPYLGAEAGHGDPFGMGMGGAFRYK